MFYRVDIEFRIIDTQLIDHTLQGATFVQLLVFLCSYHAAALLLLLPMLPELSERMRRTLTSTVAMQFPCYFSMYFLGHSALYMT